MCLNRSQYGSNPITYTHRLPPGGVPLNTETSAEKSCGCGAKTARQRCSFFVHTGSAGQIRSPDRSAFPTIFIIAVIVQQQDSGMPIRGRRCNSG